MLTPGPSINLILDLTDIVSSKNAEQGLLSAAIDPHFAEFRHLYLYYTMEDPSRNDIASARLSRIPIADGRPVREQELIILDIPRDEQASRHFGGAIRFGPDGMIISGYRRRSLL